MFIDVNFEVFWIFWTVILIAIMVGVLLALRILELVQLNQDQKLQEKPIQYEDEE